MTVTAFFEDRIVAAGERDSVTRALEQSRPLTDQAAIRVFDDESGRIVDLDYRGARSSPGLPGEGDHAKHGGGVLSPPPKPRGRPRLGVTAREVTLLPAQWEWLALQPGGASSALRRLVESARRREPGPEARRDSAYRFMTAMAGDRPGYEEALRALYRGDRPRLDALVAAWPADVRLYLARLLGDDR